MEETDCWPYHIPFVYVGLQLAMENISKQKWNQYYHDYEAVAVKYDNWLSLHNDLFSENENILELGCGFGFNTKYLFSKGHQLTATDFSHQALLKLKKENPAVKTLNLDLRNNFPFQDSVFDSVIADLCLHYFNRKTTEKIISEIIRILIPGGKLCCRVNSVFDTNHGAGQGAELEENFFFRNGVCKRFFTEDSVKELLNDFDILSLQNYDTDRYEKTKNVYEIVCRRA